VSELREPGGSLGRCGAVSAIVDAAGPASVRTVVSARHDQAAATGSGGALERELGATP
jgi:hypothetical protein